MRMVYPGFLQLSGFMGMNFDRHVTAHRDLFHNLIKGDGDSADKHREFYDEFLAVMDLTAEYYLQTIETVFLEHKLPKGKMVHRNRLVRPGQDPKGGADDGGRREGRHLGDRPDLCCTNIVHQSLPTPYAQHHLQRGVGHYGVFNGSRFRAEIAPKIREFHSNHQRRRGMLARAFGRSA